MPLCRLTPDRISCFAIGFPLLATTEYPHAPFTIAKVSLIGYNRISSGPSCTMRSHRYSHTRSAHPTRQTH
jgi:hypothetical protein